MLWNRPLRSVVSFICIAVMLVMVVGRLLSGVHWFTDIIASVVLSAALLSLYASLLDLWSEPDMN